MNREEKLAMAKGRYARLAGSDKNVKCPGVLRKVRRQIRNLEKA